jgi:hypothetical protein
MFCDGDVVAYVGPRQGGLDVGDRGRVLRAAKGASHIVWKTGALRDDITLVNNNNLVLHDPPQNAVASIVDDSLSDGILTTVAAREVYDEGGDAGLLDALSSEGSLSTLYDVAEEAISRVTASVRDCASLRPVLAQLDDDEADSFVSTAAIALLREALREND